MAMLTHALDPDILGSDWGPRKLTIKNPAGKWVVIDDVHRGKDVKLGGRAPLPAMADGVVVEVADSSVRGGMIAVDHGDDTGHRWHQTAPVGRVKVGTRVKAGQTIALVAKSSEMGTGGKGEHGHLEYRTDGRIRGEVVALASTPNPMLYMEAQMELSDRIPNANPDSKGKTPETTVGNLLQDVQANAFYAARNTNKMDALLDTTRRILLGVSNTEDKVNLARLSLEQLGAKTPEGIATELLDALPSEVAERVATLLSERLAGRA